MINLNKILIALIAFAFSFSLTAEAQISAGAITTRASSQLVLWYDEDTSSDRQSYLQITNTSSTSPVEIHVQIYSSDDTTRCLEVDFNDVLTANDTHIYEMDDIVLNNGEIATPAPVTSVDGTKGFVVVTPVVGAGDNSAISFQNLIGSVQVDRDDDDDFKVSAAGRDAVDLITGAVLPDGTVLDGISTGYLLIQPDEIVFNVTDADVGIDDFDDIDVVAFVFDDEYGPAGLLGYRAVPGVSTFSPFLFNFAEVPGSCPVATNECFNNWGLNSDFPAENQLTDPGINICDAVNLGSQDDGITSGWARLFVNSVSGNQFVVIANNASSLVSAEWSHVVGPPIPIIPQQCTNLPAECGDPECKGLEGCENAEAAGQEDFCADGIDNDDINGTDCEDFGCDGSIGDSATGAICQLGAETDCEDGFDNDANGFTDCGDGTLETADPECVALEAPGCPPPPNGDTGDDSGGCVVAAGPVATGTAAANFLLPLLPLAGAYALRRIRRRSSK